MLTNGIRWLLPRSRPKKRGYQCERQNDAWTPSSSLMSTLGGEQVAHNVLVSCRGCLHMLKRQGKKNKNESPIKAISIQTLGQMLRQKHQLSKWWGSGPQERRSRGYTMRCINKRGYWAPHNMGKSKQRALTGKSVLLWRSRHSRGRVVPCWKKIYREPLYLFGGPATRLNSFEEGMRTHVTGPSVKPGGQRGLEAAHLLEQNIQRLSQAADRAKSTEQWCPTATATPGEAPKEACLVPKPP